jgi:MFS family permease
VTVACGVFTHPRPRTDIGFAALRFIAGACAAGIYPVGMKMASTWAVSDRGLLVGILVGAQTAGLATPHLIDAWGGVDWRFTLEAASASTVVPALLIGLVGLGPAYAQASAFRARLVLQAGSTNHCASPRMSSTWRQSRAEARMDYLYHPASTFTGGHCNVTVDLPLFERNPLRDMA